MPASYLQRVQDAVHGLMSFEGLETAVLDALRSPEMARLRRVKQLGMAEWVFPAAEHTRFQHALGTSHLALRFGHHLRQNPAPDVSTSVLPSRYMIRDIGLAALFHDLGHGPLSHAWEHEVVKDFRREDWIESLKLDSHLGGEDAELLTKKKWHEIVGLGLLLNRDGGLFQSLEAHERGFALRLARLQLGRYGYAYLPGLLSGPVDVDRADWILRDGYFTGVRYGHFDLEWLISTSVVGKGPHGRLVIGFSARKGRPVVEQFLAARRFLYQTVYGHKTVKVAEGMVGGLLGRLRSLPKNKLTGSELPKSFSSVFAGRALVASDILSLDDHELWRVINSVARGVVGDRVSVDLAARISDRRYFKQVPNVPIEIARKLVEGSKWWRDMCGALKSECASIGDDREAESYFFVDYQELREETGEVWFVSDDGHAHSIDANKLVEPIEERGRLFVAPEFTNAVREVVQSWLR